MSASWERASDNSWQFNCSFAESCGPLMTTVETSAAGRVFITMNGGSISCHSFHCAGVFTVNTPVNIAPYMHVTISGDHVTDVLTFLAPLAVGDPCRSFSSPFIQHYSCSLTPDHEVRSCNMWLVTGCTVSFPDDAPPEWEAEIYLIADHQRHLIGRQKNNGGLSVTFNICPPIRSSVSQFTFKLFDGDRASVDAKFEAEFSGVNDWITDNNFTIPRYTL